MIGISSDWHQRWLTSNDRKLKIRGPGVLDIGLIWFKRAGFWETWLERSTLSQMHETIPDFTNEWSWILRIGFCWAVFADNIAAHISFFRVPFSQMLCFQHLFYMLLRFYQIHLGWIMFNFLWQFNRTIFYTSMRTNMIIEWISFEKYCQITKLN